MDISHSLMPEELQTESRLKNQLASLNASIATEHDKTKLELIESQLKTKRLELEDFHTRLYASHSGLAVHRGEMKPFTTDQAAALLADGRSATPSIRFQKTASSFLYFRKMLLARLP